MRRRTLVVVLSLVCLRLLTHCAGGPASQRGSEKAAPGSSTMHACLAVFGSAAPDAAPLADQDRLPMTCVNSSGLDWVLTGIGVYTETGQPTVEVTLAGQSRTAITARTCRSTRGTLTACAVQGAPVVHSTLRDGATCPVAPCALQVTLVQADGTPYASVNIVGMLWIP